MAVLFRCTSMLATGMLIPAAVAGVAAAAPPSSLSPSDRAAVYAAAGVHQRGGKWVLCTDDPAPTGVTVEQVRDINGDGRPEVLLTEGGTFCYGNTGAGFQLLSKQADGRWRVMAAETGMPTFLKTHGAGGWPDVEVGGPGFCFPVLRWNGRQYAFNRNEYDGKGCRQPDCAQGACSR